MFPAGAYFTTVLLSQLYRPSISQDISPLVDVKTLTELPLNRLIQVRDTFKEPQSDEETLESVSAQSKIDDQSPQALALHSKHKQNDRGGYHHVYEEENSKKSGKKSIQSIFQISVTILAFLAFGGYLLCLLVQAIRGKTMMNMMMVTTASTISAYLRPKPMRRPTRRPIRMQRPYRPKRDVWPDVDPDDMYYALVSLSEGYAGYHTIDYRKFNYSSSYFN